MLLIHWAPVRHTRNILRNGIRTTPRGTYCVPYTGVPQHDRLWCRILRQAPFRTKGGRGAPANRGNAQFNGVLFRLEDADFPLAFSEAPASGWRRRRDLGVGDELNPPCRTKEELLESYSDWLSGALVRMLVPESQRSCVDDYENRKWFGAKRQELKARGYHELRKMAAANCEDFIWFTWEWELILPRPIAPERILRIITAGQSSGRRRRAEFRARPFELNEE